VNDVAVVIAAHDAARWIGATLDSVLAGADRLAEVVVADDGSTDETAAVVSSYADAGRPVRLVRLPRQSGPAAARNAAVAATSAPHLALHDADDLWVAGRPDPRLAVLDARPEVGVVSGAVAPFTDAGAFGPTRPGPMATASIARREAWEATGGMDEGLSHAQDVDWLIRVREAGWEVVTVPEVTLRYRLRPDSQSRDRSASNHGLLTAIHGSLQRRRVGEP
jgi:glycosyltransferase involved in cell wall biosynthesis